MEQRISLYPRNIFSNNQLKMTKDTAAIRDQLGIDSDTTFYLNADYSEDIIIEEQSTKISTKTLGNAWIVGSSTNGLVGTNTGTVGGGQQVVGGSGRVTTLQRVVNPLNTFREHFRDTIFKDDGAVNTADWDTTNYRIAMSSDTQHIVVYNTIATSSEIFYNQETIIRAKLDCTETKWDGGDQILYYLSADGGGTWEEVTRGKEHSFAVTGQDLRFKIVFVGLGGSLTYIEDLQIAYII